MPLAAALQYFRVLPQRCFAARFGSIAFELEPMTFQDRYQGLANIERRGGDPRRLTRFVGEGVSTPQREILRCPRGVSDPPARDSAL